MKNHVYVMRSGSLVKVGVTSQPESRIKNVRHETKFNNLEYTFISLKVNNAFTFETLAHIELEQYHQFGEWFNCSAELAAETVCHVIGDSLSIENTTIAPSYVSTLELNPPDVSWLSSFDDIVKRGKYLACS